MHEAAAAEDLDRHQERAVALGEGELEAGLAIQIGQVEPGHDRNVLQREDAAGDGRNPQGVGDAQIGRQGLDGRAIAAEQAGRQDVGQGLDEGQRAFEHDRVGRAELGHDHGLLGVLRGEGDRGDLQRDHAQQRNAEVTELAGGLGRGRRSVQAPLDMHVERQFRVFAVDVELDLDRVLGIGDELRRPLDVGHRLGRVLAVGQQLGADLRRVLGRIGHQGGGVDRDQARQGNRAEQLGVHRAEIVAGLDGPGCGVVGGAGDQPLARRKRGQGDVGSGQAPGLVGAEADARRRLDDLGEHPGIWVQAVLQIGRVIADQHRHLAAQQFGDGWHRDRGEVQGRGERGRIPRRRAAVCNLGVEIERRGLEGGVAGVRVGIGDVAPLDHAAPLGVVQQIGAAHALGLVVVVAHHRFAEADEDQRRQEVDLLAGQVRRRQLEAVMAGSHVDPERSGAAGYEGRRIDVGGGLGVDAHALQRHLQPVVQVGRAGVRDLGLAHHDEHALAHVSDRGGADGPVGRLDAALGDLHQRGAVAEGIEVTVIDDAHIVVAALGGDMAPGDQVQGLDERLERLAPDDRQWGLLHRDRNDREVAVENPVGPGAVRAQPAAEGRQE